MFQYKTRGLPPQGMRRVYFTCHPAEFERYFEEISGEVLKNIDCAVWYNSDETYEDIETDLGQMNLFVIPVTTKLLTTKNRTVDTDVPFALAHHIPILPLMQEGGLDELFSRKFGDIQYLDQNANDATAISYEEKLTKYLHSVLTDSKLAEKVRKAFDAYIFLSYRKKDRKYANELMRLIHKNDFCRDIAIWYDEYLTPGENFNQSIADALEKSELFALVVTPNLVNETNYVQAVEYPEAAKQRKPILPAELEQTDPAQLTAMFAGIPDRVNAHDAAGLSVALKNTLVCLAKTENDKDKAHNFLIGLAYLEGIDVEIDHARAVSLITGAAEDGFPAAMKKLVSMYHDGHGVERNYRNAVEWQRRLAEYLEAACSDSNRTVDYELLFSALKELSDQLYELRGLDAAEAVAQHRLELYSCRSAEERSSVKSRLDIADCYDTLGRICEIRGNLDGAEEYFQKGLVLNEQLSMENAPIIALVSLSENYEKLGDICAARSSLDSAEEYYRKAFQLREELEEKTKLEVAKSFLATIYCKLGDICKARGDYDGAEKQYNKGCALIEQLAERGDASARDDLMFVYGRLGNLHEEWGDIDKAEDFYQKALALSEQLAKESGAAEDLRNLIVSYEKLAQIFSARGDTDGAEGFCLKAHSLCKQLAEETGTAEARSDLSNSYDHLGSLCFDRGDMEGADKNYRKSLALREKLNAEVNTQGVRRDLSICYFNLGRVCKAAGDYGGAEEHFQNASVLLEQLLEETGTLMAQSDLAACYQHLGDVRFDQGDLDGAEAFYKKEYLLLERVSEEIGSTEAWYRRSDCAGVLGDICNGRNDLGGAKEYYIIAGSISEMLSDIGTEKLRRLQSLNYARLGKLSDAWENLEGAENYHRKALAIREKLAEETGSADDRSDLSDSYFCLGRIYKAGNNLDGAEEFYRKSLALREKLAEECKSTAANTDFILSIYETATLRKPYDRALLEKAFQFLTDLTAAHPRSFLYTTFYEIFRDLLKEE